MPTDMSNPDDIRRFARDERNRCVSEREWRHRLAGYGIAVRERAGSIWLTAVVSGRDICAFDA